MTVRHRALRFAMPEVLILGSLGVGAYLIAHPMSAVRMAISREETALAAVRETVSAERTFLARRLRDEDGDRAPEYGSLSDLAAAGLFARPILVDGEGAYVEVEGYRLEVLLPEGHDRAGRVTFAAPGKEPAADLAATLFAVVAIPRRGGASGLRSFYVDARDRLYEAEGVCNVDGDPQQPPPPRVLSAVEEDDLGPAWPVWRLRPGSIVPGAH